MPVLHAVAAGLAEECLFWTCWVLLPFLQEGQWHKFNFYTPRGKCMISIRTNCLSQAVPSQVLPFGLPRAVNNPSFPPVTWCDMNIISSIFFVFAHRASPSPRAWEILPTVGLIEPFWHLNHFLALRVTSGEMATLYLRLIFTEWRQNDPTCQVWSQLSHFVKVVTGCHK